VSWSILAPVRHASEVRLLREAGADEFYAGVLSADTLHRLSNVFSHNYRPHRNANLESLDQLRDTLDEANGRPLFVVYNLRYPEDIGARVLDELSAAVELGISGVIMADLGMVTEVRRRHPDLPIHASAVAGVSNSAAAALWREVGASRVILPRAFTRPELTALDAALEGIELELFITTEKCAFANSFCMFEHGVFETDRPPMVRAAAMAGRLSGRAANEDMLVERLAVRSPAFRRMFYGLVKPMGSACTVTYHSALGPVCFVEPWENKEACGLCSLWWLRRLRHLRSLKVVGRTMPSARKVADVRSVRSAIDALEDAPDQEAFRRTCGRLFHRHRGTPCTPDLCYYEA